ncbi:mucosa-associated lymphoid tissue lymphoma translocation protein 1 [Carlito syrichta]|uniref:Mucosa-associated lymphoid tissue lymphoma translocation protein 1 n=1 Tax=Carlito syrichta TaxID=1868482 RepID=A0A3Q0ECK7_CARSF|nr:mucosa-associated lymphoid tissue lymphoma translocation protein 1 [Carlito syrichta]
MARTRSITPSAKGPPGAELTVSKARCVWAFDTPEKEGKRRDPNGRAKTGFLQELLARETANAVLRRGGLTISITRGGFQIQQATTVKNKDIRKFGGGVYVSEKGTVQQAYEENLELFRNKMPTIPKTYKGNVERKTCEDIQDVKGNTKTAPMAIPEKEFQNGFGGWTRCGCWCTASQREYFEGDHCDTQQQAGQVSSESLLGKERNSNGVREEWDSGGAVPILEAANRRIPAKNQFFRDVAGLARIAAHFSAAVSENNRNSLPFSKSDVQSIMVLASTLVRGSSGLPEESLVSRTAALTWSLVGERERGQSHREGRCLERGVRAKGLHLSTRGGKSDEFRQSSRAVVVSSQYVGWGEEGWRICCLDLEQCSLKVLEPEGSPSLCLLKLMGEKGCTVTELSDFLQAMEHTEVLQLLSPPGIKITVNPESKAVLAGQFVKLCCRATGHPFVQYQWFKMNKEIPYGNTSELIFNAVHVKDAGFYVCRVNNNFTFEFSQWSQLDVCDISEVTESFRGSFDGLSESKLQICVEPRSQKLMPGSTLVLQCVAVGSPIPHYQWFKNESLLVHETKKLYMVPYVDLEHQGTYWCHVYNDRDSQDSNKVEVIIGRTVEAVECTEDELNNLGHPANREQTTNQPLAKDKVALLIGNMNYREHPKLKAPLVDVYELTNLLRQLDFKVVSLLDLTEYEMRNAVDEFLLLLDKGVYGLLYYAGHGYENFGNSFMVPVDAPNPYRSENCLCVQNILKWMQEKETGLNVFLLDMCRKRNDYDDTIPILDALKVTANIVFGYATCQGAEAFEIQHSGLANGIFMKFLKARLLEDKKITVLLDEVAEDMGKCHLTKGKQALEIRSSLSEKRALTDPIQGAEYSAESLVRNLQWAKAHELPESMCLKFQCGVHIQLGFAAEFSNVMIIYTSIVYKPPEITMCDAYVTDFPLDLDIDPKDANKGTPEETGSYLVSKDLPKHCLYTRLSSLQKLKEHLVFTVCLSYQYSGLEDAVEEKQEVNVGKPLIAKLDMHRGSGRKTCFQTCLMSNGPHQSSPSPSQGAGHHHSSQDAFCGVYRPHLGDPDSAVPSESCPCSRTPSALLSGYYAHHYSCHFSRSNVPVETTDEMPFSFSDRLRISEK